MLPSPRDLGEANRLVVPCILLLVPLEYSMDISFLQAPGPLISMTFQMQLRAALHAWLNPTESH